MMNEAYVFDALRTPRGNGKSSGALYEIKPVELLTSCLSALQNRNQLDTSLIDDLLVGCVSPVGDQGGNIAQVALCYANWSEQVPGLQLNRYGGSGLEAINLAACKVKSGWAEMVVAGGIESMSRTPLESDGSALLFDPKVMIKSNYLPQGVSADLIATIEGFEREQLDAYALRSQRLATEAWEKGHFKKAIIPIYDQNQLLVLDHDEFVRSATTVEQLAALNPSFEEKGEWGFDAMALKKYPSIERIHHVHTAGNSSGIVDGAALVLVGSEAAGKQLGLKPRARIRSIATTSSDPTIMLLGPIPATQKALKAAGMEAKDIDLWEVHEAFAAVVLKFQQAMDIDLDRLNVNGGAISMGHPQGATGAILIGKLLDEMERRDLHTGVATTCVRGGMGLTTIIERV